MKTALVIMAAGIGSRFGKGIKQLTSLGPNGEKIIDYSIHDALEAGFDEIVFVIRRELEPLMREAVGNQVAGKIGEENVKYVYQELSNVPEGFDGEALASLRSKPWGTGQAVLACRGTVKVPFAVINADDYYGKKAFRLVHDYLLENAGKAERCCMAGFILKNTLSDFGTVTRGLCKVSAEGYLTDVVETHDILKTPEGAVANGVKLDSENPVSMNFWGFTPEFLDCLEDGFRAFLESGDLAKGEYLLPSVVDTRIKAGAITVRCLTSDDSWFGVTYAEDKPLVEASLRKLAEEGAYPASLY